MTDTALVYSPISEVLRLFATRNLSPLEYLDALVTRAEALNPRLNSLSEQYVEEARAAAKGAEEAYRRGDARPLEGIPFSVKDSLPVQGKRCTSGSYTKVDVICAESEPCVERLVLAGALVHGRATSPEFSWAWTCHSLLNGLTLNPWNDAVTCGGSCGGAAASLAAGTTPLSLGADSAGSIRMPSAMCGTVGYKPPYGRNPVGLTYCEDGYNCIGPMGRTVDDCRLMQNAMNGMHPGDPNAIHPRLILGERERMLRGMRVAFSYDMGFIRIASDVRANMERVLRYLEAEGAIVEPVETPWAREAYDRADAYGDFISQDLFRHALEKYPDRLSDYTYHFAKVSMATSLADYIGSFQSQYRAWSQFSKVIGAHDCFLCPTVATTEVPVTFRPWDRLVIEGEPVDRFVFTQLWNALRYCPALQVPSGLGHNGVPTGIQIVGKPLDDATVFGVGQHIDRAFGLFSAGRVPPLAAHDEASGGSRVVPSHGSDSA